MSLLSWLLGIAPILAPLASIGIVVRALAIRVHIRRGEQKVVAIDGEGKLRDPNDFQHLRTPS